MKKSINMTRGKPLRLMTAFALPLMFGNIFQQLYTVVDTAIVGRGVGMEALAALGSVDWLNWLILGITFGFTQGGSVRISQKFGEGDDEGLRLVMGQAALLCAVLTVVFGIAGQICLPVCLDLLRVPESLRAMGSLYFRVMMGGLPLTMFYNYCSSALRAVGDSRTPLVAMIIASFVNIILDCLAVFVLGWGIAGAAAATLTAQCVAGSICFARMWRTPALRFGVHHLRPDRTVCAELLRISLPLTGKNTVVAVGGIAVQSVVNGFGTGFIAGYTATNKLYGLLEIAAGSYSAAVTTYVGQNYGARQHDRIRHGVKSAMVLSIVIAVVIGGAMILLGRPITQLFISSSDPVMMAEAVNTAYQYLCCMSLSLPMLYLLYIVLSAMQGMGRTVSTMISGMVELLFRVGIALIVGPTGFGPGLFLAEVSAWWGAGVFMILDYRIHAPKILIGGDAPLPQEE